LSLAIEPDHSAKAQEISGWNPTTTRAMLAVLDQALQERHTRPAPLARERRR
jgi:hypothetical protein